MGMAVTSNCEVAGSAITTVNSKIRSCCFVGCGLGVISSIACFSCLLLQCASPGRGVELVRVC